MMNPGCLGRTIMFALFIGSLPPAAVAQGIGGAIGAAAAKVDIAAKQKELDGLRPGGKFSSHNYVALLGMIEAQNAKVQAYEKDTYLPKKQELAKAEEELNKTRAAYHQVADPLVKKLADDFKATAEPLRLKTVAAEKAAREKHDAFAKSNDPAYISGAEAHAAKIAELKRNLANPGLAKPADIAKWKAELAEKEKLLAAMQPMLEKTKEKVKAAKDEIKQLDAKAREAEDALGAAKMAFDEALGKVESQPAVKAAADAQMKSESVRNEIKFKTIKPYEDQHSKLRGELEELKAAIVPIKAKGDALIAEINRKK